MGYYRSDILSNEVAGCLRDWLNDLRFLCEKDGGKEGERRVLEKSLDAPESRAIKSRDWVLPEPEAIRL
jgi:hypothetical protein